MSPTLCTIAFVFGGCGGSPLEPAPPVAGSVRLRVARASCSFCVYSTRVWVWRRPDSFHVGLLWCEVVHDVELLANFLPAHNACPFSKEDLRTHSRTSVFLPLIMDATFGSIEQNGFCNSSVVYSTLPWSSMSEGCLRAGQVEEALDIQVVRCKDQLEQHLSDMGFASGC